MPRVKRVIYLFQSGGPSQLELFDYKPLLRTMNGEQLPDSVRKGQRLTGMTAFQRSFPLAGSQFEFARHGKSGTYVSELLPHTAKIVDELCIVRSMHTEAINHDPAITFFQTGSQQAGRPAIGAWLSLRPRLRQPQPARRSSCCCRARAKATSRSTRGSGAAASCPSQHQGVQFRERQGSRAVSERSRRRHARRPPAHARYAARARGSRSTRSVMRSRDRRAHRAVRDGLPHADQRARGRWISANEPDATFALYGHDARKPGTFAANCLLARRLAERNVRFIQLYHQGWDQHGNLPQDIQR